MPFFDKFGYTTYQIGSNQILVRDIIRSVRLTVDKDSDLFEEYRVMDNEKLENIAYNFYGSTEYHWVLAFINGILDQNNFLPKSDAILRKAAAKIYSDIDAVHHWVDPNNRGEWVDAQTPNCIPVTNIEHMTNENEKKRLIKILKPIFLTNFVSLYMEQIQDQ